MEAKFFEMGMGLFGWHDDEIALAGGMRAHRMHPPGKLFLQFTIVDLNEKDAAAKANGVGKVMFLVGFPEEGNPVVEKWIEIAVDKARRGQGFGDKTVNLVRKIALEDLEVCDIKPKARKFWEKVGVDVTAAPGKRFNGLLKKEEPVISLQP